MEKLDENQTTTLLIGFLQPMKKEVMGKLSWLQKHV